MIYFKMESYKSLKELKEEKKQLKEEAKKLAQTIKIREEEIRKEEINDSAKRHISNIIESIQNEFNIGSLKSYDDWEIRDDWADDLFCSEGYPGAYTKEAFDYCIEEIFSEIKTQETYLENQKELLKLMKEHLAEESNKVKWEAK